MTVSLKNGNLPSRDQISQLQSYRISGFFTYVTASAALRYIWCSASSSQNTRNDRAGIYKEHYEKWVGREFTVSGTKPTRRGVVVGLLPVSVSMAARGISGDPFRLEVIYEGETKRKYISPRGLVFAEQRIPLEQVSVRKTDIRGYTKAR